MRKLGLAVGFAVFATAEAAAQRVQPELRVDALGPRPYAIQPGIGASVLVGTYTRLSVALGVPTERQGGRPAGGWRQDLLVRVTLDPFRQQRWALALGGGVSIRRHTYLAVLADLEGPERWGWIPVFQAGASGGPRAGIVFRRAIAGRR